MQKPSEDSQIHNFNFLEPGDFEFLCFDLTRELMSASEPIPDYSTRDHALLESALANPKRMFGGKLLYPTLVKQAAILFYSLIKNHPFRNGNKRIAVMALLLYLGLNNRWLEIPPMDLYDLACKVSESESNAKEDILNYLELEIKTHLMYFQENLA